MIYLIVSVIVIFCIFTFTTYNTLIDLNNKVKEAFSVMDVYLKKRWDLIPNIVNTVKGYTSHEKETLKEIIELRNNSYNTMSEEEKINTNQKLSKNISKIIALSESYPDLKANENFKQLTMELSKIEDDIANSRKYYNGVIRQYNNKVEMFPGNLVANLFRFKTRKMFEIESNERENVKVEF